MTTNPGVLETRELAVGYRTRRGRRAVLEHVELSVAPGDFVCVIGPNGIGKSTLLRTLGGMQPALSGTVVIGGEPLETLSAPELARRLAVVLTDRVTVDALSARRIVELGRYPHSDWIGRIGPRDRDVVEWAMASAGAAHLAGRDFSQLSDGEQQRVLVARALAQEPVLLLLDEPTAFLDVSSRVELMGLLRSITRQSGVSAIASTHDLELALRTADVLWLIMPGGEVVVGSPEDVIVSGALARAFEGRQIRFLPEERTFRWRSAGHGAARVSGTGLPASMARAVLEREGYTVVVDGTTAVDVDVVMTEGGWQLSAGTRSAAGTGFRALAAAIRRLDHVPADGASA